VMTYLMKWNHLHSSQLTLTHRILFYIFKMDLKLTDVIVISMPKTWRLVISTRIGGMCFNRPWGIDSFRTALSERHSFRCFAIWSITYNRQSVIHGKCTANSPINFDKLMNNKILKCRVSISFRAFNKYFRGKFIYQFINYSIIWV